METGRRQNARVTLSVLQARRFICDTVISPQAPYAAASLAVRTAFWRLRREGGSARLLVPARTPVQPASFFLFSYFDSLLFIPPDHGL